MEMYTNRMLVEHSTFDPDSVITRVVETFLSRVRNGENVRNDLRTYVESLGLHADQLEAMHQRTSGIRMELWRTFMNTPAVLERAKEIHHQGPQSTLPVKEVVDIWDGGQGVAPPAEQKPKYDLLHDLGRSAKSRANSVRRSEMQKETPKAPSASVQRSTVYKVFRTFLSLLQ